jgi:hypothetical protein
MQRRKANNDVRSTMVSRRKRPSWCDVTPMQTMFKSNKELEAASRLHESQRLVDRRDIEAARAKLAIQRPELAGAIAELSGFITEFEGVFGPVTCILRRKNVSS